MNQDASANSESIGIPASAAEAWAVVYIDVAEKLDAEEQQAEGVAGHSKEQIATPDTNVPQGERSCPST